MKISDAMYKLKAGDTVYVFNGEKVYEGIFKEMAGIATRDQLDYCPNGKLGDALMQIEFDERIGLIPGPFGFTENNVFLSHQEALDAQEKFFRARPGERERVNRLYGEGRVFPKPVFN